MYPRVISEQLSRDLDIVRGASALVVLLAHICQWFVMPLVGLDHFGVKVLVTASHFAVLAFLALSGFVITSSLVNNYSRNGRVDVSAYVRKRLERILVPSISAVLFSVLVAIWIVATEAHGSKSFRTAEDLYVAREFIAISLRDTLASLLLCNGIIPGFETISTNGPLWSLSIEFWLYFLALIAAVGICNFEKEQSAAAMFIALGMLLLFFVTRPMSLGQYVGYWVIGSVLYFHFAGLPWAGKALNLTCFAGGLAVVTAILAGVKLDLVQGVGVGGLVAIPIKAALILIGARAVALLKYCPGLGMFVWLSRSSYTLYVFHFPLLCLVFSLTHQQYLAWSSEQKVTFLFLLGISIIVFSHFLAFIVENKSIGAWIVRRLWKWFRLFIVHLNRHTHVL
jgi:peptidoglycan/LPS O-acetylase OafA/YrhL